MPDSNLQHQLLAAQDNIDSLHQSVVERDEELVMANETIRELKAKLSHLQSEEIGREAYIEQLQHELESAQQDAQAASQRSIDATRMLEQAREEQRHLTRELERMEQPVDLASSRAELPQPRPSALPRRSMTWPPVLERRFLDWPPVGENAFVAAFQPNLHEACKSTMSYVPDLDQIEQPFAHEAQQPLMYDLDQSLPHEDEQSPAPKLTPVPVHEATQDQGTQTDSIQQVLSSSLQYNHARHLIPHRFAHFGASPWLCAASCLSLCLLSLIAIGLNAAMLLHIRQPPTLDHIFSTALSAAELSDQLLSVVDALDLHQSSPTSSHSSALPLCHTIEALCQLSPNPTKLTFYQQAEQLWEEALEETFRCPRPSCFERNITSKGFSEDCQQQQWRATISQRVQVVFFHLDHIARIRHLRTSERTILQRSVVTTEKQSLRTVTRHLLTYTLEFAHAVRPHSSQHKIVNNTYDALLQETRRVRDVLQESRSTLLYACTSVLKSPGLVLGAIRELLLSPSLQSSSSSSSSRPASNDWHPSTPHHRTAAYDLRQAWSNWQHSITGFQHAVDIFTKANAEDAPALPPSWRQQQQECLSSVDNIEIALGGEAYLSLPLGGNVKVLHAEMRAGCLI